MLVLAITILGVILGLRVAPTNLAMLFLLGTVFISYKWGFWPALTYSLISTITFDFFFIPPYESFAVTDFWYLFTAITSMGVAFFVSILTAAVRQHAITAEHREAHTAILYDLMRSLAFARGSAEVLHAAAVRMKTTLGLDVGILLPAKTGGLAVQLQPAGYSIDASFHAAAEKIFAAAQSCATGREGAFLPLRAGGDVVGVMVLSAAQAQPAFGGAENLVLEAMAGQVALAIKRAILEEKARNAEREQQRAQQAKAEAIATLAGGLAHDLNNLLTGVLGYATLVADSLPAGHPARSLLSELSNAGERAAHIVAQVLSYAGKGRLFDELVDLSSLADGFVKNLPPLPPNVELTVTLGDRLPRLAGDRNQILQLIGNLYLNAVEAIGQAPGRITISTYYQDCPRKAGNASGDSELPAGECIYLSVADTGCGIEDSIRSRIFDPFFTTKFVGRGLGLSAAEGIMRAHHGAIRLVSELGRGSTFTCVFPVPDRASERA